MRAIRQKYSEEGNQVEWFCDLGESGASASREEYQRLREHVAEYDVVVAHELDRLGRSFADLAGFVDDLREKDVGIDLVNQPIGTVGEDDWMAEMMLNMMMVFADAERKMIRSRVQEGIDGRRRRQACRSTTVRIHRRGRLPPASARRVRPCPDLHPRGSQGPREESHRRVLRDPRLEDSKYPRTSRGELRRTIR
jgi:DNA invertase Pin-like site-specific DNA recombinase